jgi:hypothetical protein
MTDQKEPTAAGPTVITNKEVTPDGKYEVLTTTTVQTTTTMTEVTTPPPSSGAPVIPANAGVKMLDGNTNWKGEHDTTTGGSATGSTKYLGSGKGRLFTTNFTNNAGYRWHNMFVKDTTPNQYCYKLGVSFDHPELIGCLELDFTHVIGSNKVVYPCTQATSWNLCWEYTTTPSGRCHWNVSSLKTDPRKWPANEMQLIELYSKRDDSGHVTYIGVTFNGTYTPFESSANGLSMLNQNWTVGDLLVNFQIGGRGSSGTINATVLNMETYYWKA